MKKSVIIITVIVLFAFSVLLFSNFGKQYNEENSGRELSIRWEMVNLRENYSTSSDVIEELHQGEKIVLTGNSYEYGDGPNSSWREVRTESGITGWVVSQSIQW